MFPQTGADGLLSCPMKTKLLKRSNEKANIKISLRDREQSKQNVVVVMVSSQIQFNIGKSFKLTKIERTGIFISLNNQTILRNSQLSQKYLTDWSKNLQRMIPYKVIICFTEETVSKASIYVFYDMNSCVCACVCVSAPPLIVLLSNPTRKESSS